MKEVFVFCSGSKHLKEGIKKSLKERKPEFVDLEIEKFPDKEINTKIPKDIKNKKVIFVQSFYENPNEKIIETLFAGYTAKQLGAKKINLFASYFPYLRKDKRFEKGECISAEAVGKMFKVFNKVFILEPHLHRVKNLKKTIKNSVTLDVHEEIARYLRDVRLKDPFFISPDIESERIAKEVAGLLKKNFAVLKKKRFNSRKVKIDINKNLNIQGRDIIIIDDMISTGNTMLEAIKEIKEFKPRKIYCIGVHGIFVENALERIENDATVVSTNTIPSKASIIDISKKILEV